MFGHDLNQLIVSEFPAGHKFPVSGLLGAQSILRFQPGLMQ